MGTSTRDPSTDPRPGDTIHDQFGERWTVDSVDARGDVHFTDGSGMTLRTWRGYFDDPNYTVTAADGNALAEGSDGPAPDTAGALDRLGTDAQTLVTLLRAAALAAAPGTPKYARDAAEGWLRGVFAATYGTYPADATERDPRTDPQPGDTKTWWDDEEHYRQTVAAVDHDEHYAVSIEETHIYTGDAITFDDLTLEDWSNAHVEKGAEWFSGGAS